MPKRWMFLRLLQPLLRTSESCTPAACGLHGQGCTMAMHCQGTGASLRSLQPVLLVALRLPLAAWPFVGMDTMGLQKRCLPSLLSSTDAVSGSPGPAEGCCLFWMVGRAAGLACSSLLRFAEIAELVLAYSPSGGACSVRSMVRREHEKPGGARRCQ